MSLVKERFANMAPQDITQKIGNEPPLSIGRHNAPDRREISARWLSGTVLTGLTSTLLMGVALFTSLDGRQQLATPPEIAAISSLAQTSPSAFNPKSGRLLQTPSVETADENADTDIERMMISTKTRDGEREIIRMQPFMKVRMSLGAGHTTDRKYPAFNPLSVFASDKAVATARSGTIYGAEIESDISLRTISFVPDSEAFDRTSDLSNDEVEQLVRQYAGKIDDGEVKLQTLNYVQPARFGNQTLSQDGPVQTNIRVVQENVSVLPAMSRDVTTFEFREKSVPINRTTAIADILSADNYEQESVDGMVDALQKLMGNNRLEVDDNVVIGAEHYGTSVKIVRTSVYRNSEHLLSIALDDQNQYVPAKAPYMPEATAKQEKQSVAAPAPARRRGALPNIYDGIYRASYHYGLNEDMTASMIKLLAAEVDFRAQLKPNDELDVFFSYPDESNQATEQSQLLYIRVKFGNQERTYFRHQDASGNVGFYDRKGRNARQFLLRNPVPNGRFRSGFGMRRHPVLRYRKMHTGVDWSAPRGTPIIASGSGVVEKAGWAGGYGRQTIIRHANGYVSSYSHQHAIAKGIRPGARVSQGQIIGYVGSTGLSTGPHLHYELIVNGTKVDPMRVRLPSGKSLRGAELDRFNAEVVRLEKLLGLKSDVKLASNS